MSGNNFSRGTDGQAAPDRSANNRAFVPRMPASPPLFPNSLRTPSSLINRYRQSTWLKKYFKQISLVTLCILLLGASWIVRGITDGQSSWFSPQKPTGALMITTLADDGSSGSLRQELNTIHQGQNAVLVFAPELQGDPKGLVLQSSLSIDHDVTIEASNRDPIDSQVYKNNQITITANSENIAIKIKAGNSVSFQNIVFEGSRNVADPAVLQPDAFLQVEGANMTIVNCKMVGFSSDSEGSALSNLYGNVQVENSIIKGNRSTGDGGAIYNLGLSSLDEGVLTLDNSIVISNNAFYSGGGIYNLGGTLIILHNSSIVGNGTQYNDAEIEGGGAIASQDGTIFISSSAVSLNNAHGYGGGMLLIGTNAQILSSTINKNTASIANRGGGIDVETNHENGQQSYLTLTGSPPQSNTAGGVPQDINGQILSGGQQPQSVFVTSKAFNAPNLANTPSVLTINDFSHYCQGQKNDAGQAFVTAAPSTSVEGESIIVCVTADQTQISLAEVEHTQNETEAVQAVCQSTYFPQKTLTDVLARHFNYHDPLSWQCFQNERALGIIAESLSNKARLDAYCQKYYPAPDAKAILQNSPASTAYDWKCIFHATPYRIQMDVVCQSFFDKQARPNAISVLPDFRPYSWQCWEPVKVD